VTSNDMSHEGDHMNALTRDQIETLQSAGRARVAERIAERCSEIPEAQS
jgi:hypothetical protein